ncbi:MAG: hypothetical protein NVV74_24970 [Magnetospirillum sp.]|nr:hypothetical protein [Magnetospirillum sp.]
MSSNPSNVLVIEVPVTLCIAVSFPDGVPADGRTAAEDLARQAAQRLTHVSGSRLRAFNAVNKIHAQGRGEVRSVVAAPCTDNAA